MKWPKKDRLPFESLPFKTLNMFILRVLQFYSLKYLEGTSMKAAFKKIAMNLIEFVRMHLFQGIIVYLSLKKESYCCFFSSNLICTSGF